MRRALAALGVGLLVWGAACGKQGPPLRRTVSAAPATAPEAPAPTQAPAPAQEDREAEK